MEANKKIKDFLLNNLEDERSFDISESEISEIYRIVENDLKIKQFKGLYHERTKYASGFKEFVFSKNWIDSNTPVVGLNYGLGILEALFIKTTIGNGIENREFILDINERDRLITSTVVQWLGSNYGWEFLNKCIEECGYKMVKTKV